MRDLDELILLMEKAYEQAKDHSKGPVSVFPTDIRYLKEIMDHIDFLGSKNRHGTTQWLEILLQNPFPLKISEERLGKVINFFLEATKTESIRKSALRSLGMLGQKANVKYHYTEEPRFYIHGIEVSEIIYYGFLSQLSALGGKVGVIPIKSNDSIVVKKMKIEIMSNNPGCNTLKIFFEMLNERDSRLGWTLCKSFLKVTKYTETDSVVSALKERCNMIFANESTWINAMTILGMMSLRELDVGDVTEIIRKGVSYTNEFVSNSEMVRESALFLLWALTRRNSAMSKDLLCLAVGRALFDPSLSCRRGAAAVVLEHVGRFPEEGREELISLINFHSVKRLRNCSAVVGRVLEMLGCEEIFEDILLKNLFHRNLETKYQSGHCISKHFGGNRVMECISSTSFKTSSDFTSLFVLVKEFTEQNRKDEIAKAVEIVAKLKVDSSFCRYKDFHVFVENYLKAVKGLENTENKSVVCENLYMFLTKNSLPEEVSKVSWIFINKNEGFAAQLARSIGRGTEGFILSNSRNERYKDQVRKKYLEFLRNGNIDTKTYVMKAIWLSGRVKEYEEHIISGLENYYVDSRGDVSFRLRRESLMASFLMDDNLVSSRYFVRYFVDKSKTLRDECILLCRNSGIFPEGFEYIHREGYSVDSSKLRLVSGFLNAFYNEFKRLESESKLGNDRMLFAASIAASKHLEEEHLKEFLCGVLGTIGSSDTSLCIFITEMVFKTRERFIKIMKTIFSQNFRSYERVMLPAIELVCEIIRLEIEEGNLFIFGSNSEILGRLSLVLQEGSVPSNTSLSIKHVLEKLPSFRSRNKSNEKDG
ncbi:beta-tubulin folding cofactor D [Encephalitozoon intestinalis ATCC 50506]|uniref:Beta-tubulin folding cofactor D n=1 Tax=Encephalitozoon intestinalis (strain ATCC 50506) TaxID=876142 RepID=E0S7E2_ENCIT|nr:beta-tubulin folding cofactor D [Encephalitozoon intestinalis ATCC 50506]ADM11621.1 beta-tubulin folding cofactor D [Encephalitozoon intestinalis ATCC 50506]UTX45352.1 cullin-associated NEDD8-dissociated protein [Encephalitozoon intestinalis]